LMAMSAAVQDTAAASAASFDSISGSAVEMSAALRAAYENVAQAAFLAKNAQDTYRDTLAVSGADSITEDAALDLVTNALIRQVEASAALAAAKLELASATAAEAARAAEAAAADAAEAAGLGELGAASEASAVGLEELAAANEAASVASSHSITDIQATSGAIRVFEMNSQGGVRAAENFISSVLGLGGAFQAIFPIVGLIAVVEIISRGAENFEKWHKAVEDAARNIAEAWDKANESITSEIDATQSRVDHLIEQRDHLLGRAPSNGLAIQLDDAADAANRLTKELTASNAQYEKLLQEKGTQINAFSAFLTNQAPTGDTTDALSGVGKQLEDKDQGQSRNIRAAQASGDPKQVEQANNERNVVMQQAYATAIKTVADSLKVAEKAQTDYAASVKITEKDQEAVGEAGLSAVLNPAGSDQSAKIAELQGALAQLQQQKKLLAVSAQESQIKPQVDNLNNQKSADRVGNKEESAAKKAQAEKERAERAADDQALAKLQQAHQVTNAEEIAFWQQRATIDTAGVARIDEINKRIGSLSQQNFKEQSEQQQKSLEESQRFADLTAKVAEDGNKPLLVERSSDSGGDEQQIKATSEAYAGWAVAVRTANEIAQQNSNTMAEVMLHQREEEGTISKAGAAHQLAALHAKEYEEALAKLQAELAVINAEGANTPAQAAQKQGQQQQNQNQQTQLTGQSQVTSASDQAKVAAAMSSPYIKAFDQITEGWNKTMDGILMGQTTVARGFEKLASQMVLSIVNSLAKMLENYVRSAATELLVHIQTQEAKATSSASFAAIEKVVNTLTADSNIAASAAVGAAGAAASAAAIPVVGPALAPAAAASTYTQILALTSLASAGGGWGQVPQDTLAMVHKNEMVLPASIAGPVRGMAAAGGARGGNTNHFHTNATFNGVADQKTFGSMLAKNNRTLAAGVRKAQRSGRFA
jgi:hypothetical protein